jgi:hypothetical protein
MKMKLTPILKMLTVTVTVAISIYYTNAILLDLPNYETLMKESSWIFADLVHVPRAHLVGIMIDNLGLGIALGAAFGLLFGSAFTHSNKS